MGGVLLLGEIWPLVDPEKKGWDLSKGRSFFWQNKGQKLPYLKEKKKLNSPYFREPTYIQFFFAMGQSNWLIAQKKLDL